MVITADCDLANNKHRDQVTCVPVLEANDYLVDMILSKTSEGLEAKGLEVVSEVLAGTEYPRVSEERMRDWVHEEEPVTVADQLAVPDGPKRERLLGALGALKMLKNQKRGLEETTNLLREANQMLPNGKKPEGFSESLASTIHSAFRQTPGDAFFLNAVANDLASGYFAYLRHVVQISEAEIALGPARSAATYRRISAIDERYVHAIVQQFALVFMSIGMPESYESSRAGLAGSFVK